MDKLESMAVFVATVDKGSLSAAAEAFKISAPMAGKHIRSLEELLGTRLLTRTTRRQSLTEIGRTYLEQCRLILEQVRLAESGTQRMQAAPRGLLRINSAVAFGSYALAPMLARFLNTYPQIQAELTLNDRVIDIVDEGYDVAFRIGTLADSSLVARRLADYRVTICAAPSYLAKAGTPTHPNDLSNHQCLGFSHWTRKGGWKLGRTDTPADGWPVSRLQSNHSAALRMAALEGFGVTMQYAGMLEDDITQGRLVRLMPDFEPPPLPMHLVYPKDRQPVPKLSHFIDYALQEFGYPH